MYDLVGQKIVVTRPAHQAQRFIDELTARGATVIPFPTIVIRFRKYPLTEAEQNVLANSSLWIFTSANAVTGSIRLGLFDTPTDADIACIGRTTASVLSSHCVEPNLVPESNGDSETLLRMLAAASTYQSITIIRGGEGRNKLSTELQKQGVNVSTLDVYARVLPEPDPETLRQLSDALPCTVCITSNQGLLNLLTLIPSDVCTGLFESDLIVNSVRGQRLAEINGFRAKIVVASPPGDQGQLAALLCCNQS